LTSREPANASTSVICADAMSVASGRYAGTPGWLVARTVGFRGRWQPGPSASANVRVRTSPCISAHCLRCTHRSARTTTYTFHEDVSEFVGVWVCPRRSRGRPQLAQVGTGRADLFSVRNRAEPEAGRRLSSRTRLRWSRLRVAESFTRCTTRAVRLSAVSRIVHPPTACQSTSPLRSSAHSIALVAGRSSVVMLVAGRLHNAMQPRHGIDWHEPASIARLVMFLQQCINTSSYVCSPCNGLLCA
jgi:hypothetical protein